jgi:lycopene beta-cyclase
MKNYDFIIAGGGAAGLSLAFYLSKSSLKNKKVLIIDKDRKEKNDRTWGFWSREKTAFDEIVHLKFNQLNFYSRIFNQQIALHQYNYNVIRGIDFYHFIKNHLKSYSNFEFLVDAVESVSDKANGGVVVTAGGTFSADWVFSSIYDEKEILKAAASSLYLRQHFKGLVIKIPQPVFDAQTFTMFDFRTPQHDLMRFFYVIPHSANEALVEYTLFSEHLLEKSEYDTAIADYIKNVLKIESYEVVDEEFGVIPMTNYRFPETTGKHIVNIGSLGGSSKPSSGYTFMRIQRHVQKVVARLEGGLPPVVSASSNLRYRFYDAVLLNILKRNGGLAEKLFSYMFKNNRIQSLFQFLDEQGGLVNDLKVITSLPPWPFLRSTFQLLLKNK